LLPVDRRRQALSLCLAVDMKGDELSAIPGRMKKPAIRVIRNLDGRLRRSGEIEGNLPRGRAPAIPSARSAFAQAPAWGSEFSG